MLNNEDWPVCSSQKMTYVRLWNLELFVQVSKFQGRCLCFFCWNEWRQGIRQTCCQISRRNLPDAAVPLCPCVFFAYIWAKIISISKISETIMWHFDVDGCSTLTQNWKVDECCVPTKKLFKSSALLETFFPQDHLSTSVEEIGCFFFRRRFWVFYIFVFENRLFLFCSVVFLILQIFVQTYSFPVCYIGFASKNFSFMMFIFTDKWGNLEVTKGGESVLRVVTRGVNCLIIGENQANPCRRISSTLM